MELTAKHLRPHASITDLYQYFLLQSLCFRQRSSDFPLSCIGPSTTAQACGGKPSIMFIACEARRWPSRTLNMGNLVIYVGTVRLVTVVWKCVSLNLPDAWRFVWLVWPSKAFSRCCQTLIVCLFVLCAFSIILLNGNGSLLFMIGRRQLVTS